MKIYNSLTRKKEELIPLRPPFVNIYTCGVTVYDESHIGHARSLFIFDLITRYLRYRGFKVKFVRNITDIDDKIINRAKEVNADWRKLVKNYIKSYYRDLKLLGIKKADFEPLATKNISDMIRYIKVLIQKGYAYESGGDVYFNVRAFKEYGKLSGQTIEEMFKCVRIEPNAFKKDPLDFALWKASKEDEPGWDSPWGRGRPGWHIECSVMSQKFLRSYTLDIHAGGRDLIFPHHENEIAQAEAFSGKPFARYWLHHGLLTINGQKMSKSLGNFVTIKDFIARYEDADLLKMFFLTTHYSHPIDYTEEKIKEAKAAKRKILIFMEKVRRLKTPSFFRKKDFPEVQNLKNKFIEKMDDDFNTPEGLACIFEAINLGYKKETDRLFLKQLAEFILESAKILGLTLKSQREVFVIPEAQIREKIEERNRARREKNYVLADKIREELAEKGIILEDGKDGQTYWRKKYE